jgi:hypothetical protein
MIEQIPKSRKLAAEIEVESLRNRQFMRVQDMSRDDMKMRIPTALENEEWD